MFEDATEKSAILNGMPSQKQAWRQLSLQRRPERLAPFNGVYKVLERICFDKNALLSSRHEATARRSVRAKHIQFGLQKTPIAQSLLISLRIGDDLI
jgi:hypothetical protein